MNRLEALKMAQEKNFENRIKSFLKNEGCYFLKYWVGGNFTKSGIPDLLICCNGSFGAVELKAKSGKQIACYSRQNRLGSKQRQNNRINLCGRKRR